jgi:hypothetical protein
MELVKALPISEYRVLTDEQTVLVAPIPALAGPGTAELELHSIPSYGYASHCSLCSSAPMLDHTGPCLGILARNAG